MTITRDTADRAMLAWNLIKEGKKPTIRWNPVMSAGEEVLRWCEKEKLIRLSDKDQGDNLYLDSRYHYNVVDIRDYQLTPSDSEWDYLESGEQQHIQWYDGMLHIVLDNGDELAFKIKKDGGQ